MNCAIKRGKIERLSLHSILVVVAFVVAVVVVIVVALVVVIVVAVLRTTLKDLTDVMESVCSGWVHGVLRRSAEVNINHHQSA